MAAIQAPVLIPVLIPDPVQAATPVPATAPEPTPRRHQLRNQHRHQIRNQLPTRNQHRIRNQHPIRIRSQPPTRNQHQPRTQIPVPIQNRIPTPNPLALGNSKYISKRKEGGGSFKPNRHPPVFARNPLPATTPWSYPHRRSAARTAPESRQASNRTRPRRSSRHIPRPRCTQDL